MGYNSTLYMQNDGCVKQYKSGNALYMTCLLANAHGININCSITCAHHGKSSVDALAGSDKHYLNNGYIQGIDSTMVDHNFESLSEAQKAMQWLSSSSRVDGLLGDTKHKKKADERTVKSRRYNVSNYSEDNPLPLGKCGFRIVHGLHKGKKRQMTTNKMVYMKCLISTAVLGCQKTHVQ